MIALGADEIVMHPNSHLGPVDMQVGTKGQSFSTEDMSAFLDYVRKTLGVTDQKHLTTLFESMCQEVGSVGIGFTERSSRLAIELGKRLLESRSESGGDSENAKRQSLVEKLSREFHMHDYPLSPKEAADLGLHVQKGNDDKLNSLMWEAWLDIERDLKEREPYLPMSVLLNSSEAHKLLSPVPQLDIPANLGVGSYITTSVAECQAAATESVKPVDVSHLKAIIESSRISFHQVSEEKILASRLPDLSIQYNEVVVFRGWKQISLTQGA